MPAPIFDVQLEGSIKFCTVDSAGIPATGALVEYGTEVAALGISRSRDTVDRRPTFADARTVKKAAGLVEQVTVMFVGDEGNATGFHSLVWTALETPPCELYFAGVMKPGPISATNPVYRGYVIVLDVDGGGTPGDSKWQSKTWAARNIVKAII